MNLIRIVSTPFITTLTCINRSLSGKFDEGKIQNHYPLRICWSNAVQYRVVYKRKNSNCPVFLDRNQVMHRIPCVQANSVTSLNWRMLTYRPRNRLTNRRNRFHRTLIFHSKRIIRNLSYRNWMAAVVQCHPVRSAKVQHLMKCRLRKSWTWNACIFLQILKTLHQKFKQLHQPRFRLNVNHFQLI